MQLREPIPAGRMFIDALVTSCLVVAAWTLGTAIGSRHPLQAQLRVTPSPAALSASTSVSSDVIPARAQSTEQRLAPTNAADSAIEHPKRGIRPPWRENAIPELRRQPGRKAKSAAA